MVYRLVSDIERAYGLVGRLALAVECPWRSLVAMRCDFHLHTTFSDGVCSPAALLERVRARGLRCWAITDHDDCSAYEALREEPGLIPGVEITSACQNREVHVVGLGIDPRHPELAGLLQSIRAIRGERFQRLGQMLAREHDINLNLEAALPQATRSPSRRHLASAIRAQGLPYSPREIFARFLGDDAVARCELPDFPALGTVAETIRAAGGVAILAHPGIYANSNVVEQYLAQGLDGLEVRHPHLPPLMQDALEAIAERRGLLRSCGSDFHQDGPRRIGDWRLSRAALRPLLERIGWTDPLRS